MLSIRRYLYCGFTVSGFLILYFVEQSKWICDIPAMTNVDEFYEHIRNEQNSRCKNLVGFGPKNADGEKLVCLDDEFDIKPGNCIVLSFGIGFDWSFDNAMDRFGCTVYAFDPTIDKEDFNPSANIQFFNLGLSDVKGVVQLGFFKKNCTVDRYEGILQKLNITDRKIDYLKIDIEGSELNFFKDVFYTTPHLLKNVKQIGMEIHPGHAMEDFKVSSSKNLQPYWEYMKLLECFGFEILSSRPNVIQGFLYKFRGKLESCCYEIVWGNKYWK